MMRNMKEMKWGYLMGTTSTFDAYRIGFGKQIGTNETITIVRPLSLAKELGNLLYVSESENGLIGKTSPIVKEYWLEDFSIGNEQIALVKCFETKSGSKYYFAPMCVL